MNEEIITVQAKVKWFSLFKGFGFVSVEGIKEDVFLHFSVFEKSGLSHLNNNDVIECKIVANQKGYQVVEICQLVFSGKYFVEEQDPEIMQASMKWFNPIKGFGFAQLKSGEDVFIHANLLKKRHLTTIEPNQQLKLLVHRTNYGFEALDIILN